MTKIHTKINIFILIVLVYFVAFSLNPLNSSPTSLNHSATSPSAKISATADNYTLDYNNTWGGIDYDEGWDIALDDSGNSYISGTTKNFGAGDYDAFIAKYDSSGNSLMNITWGGNGIDSGRGITLDNSGNIYLTGRTNTSGTDDYDAFVAKFNSTGYSLLNITWGGSEYDEGWDIEVDDSGNIFITGETESFGAGDIDAFIAKFNSTGYSLMNNTWGGSNSDSGYDIELDSFGNIYIVGVTWSFGIDAFVAKFNSSGYSVLNITWGGGDLQMGLGIVLDGFGNIYITGYAYGYGNLAQAFIAKFNSTGHLNMSIIWGGSDYDFGRDIAVDDSENILITGYTNSFGEGDYDVFITKFNRTGHTLMNITWGGSKDDRGYGIILDNYGNILITGYTESFGAGDEDAFIAKYEQDNDNNGGNPSGAIPGYSLIFLIGFLGLSIILLTKKHFK